jgi:CO/xanthine dehydrogenase FAD-binding subunit
LGGDAPLKPPPLEYRRPDTLEEALTLLAEGGWEAKPLAGGQSLVPLLNLRFARPSLLVDLNRLPGLDRIEPANGAVRVGALVRQSGLGRSALIRDRCPLVADCLPFVGHFATRNRGTVGGSIAHGDAAAELPLALVTLGGSVVVESAQGRRETPAEAFFVSHFTTALEPGELVVETLWPGAADGWGYAFEELAQRHGDYGLSLAACALRVEAGKVAEARICLGAVTARPTLVEVPLVGRAVDADAAREAAEAGRASIEPSPTVHASSDYLRHLTGVLVERAVLRAWRNATEGDV